MSTDAAPGNRLEELKHARLLRQVRQRPIPDRQKLLMVFDDFYASLSEGEHFSFLGSFQLARRNAWEDMRDFIRCYISRGCSHLLMGVVLIPSLRGEAEAIQHAASGTISGSPRRLRRLAMTENVCKA